MSQKIKWEKETFREFCNHVKDANISFGDFKHTDSTEYPHKDSIPDFVKEDKSIAVELTEYHRDEHSNNEKGENLRKLESIGKSILKNASDHFRYLSPSRRLNVFLNPKNIWQIQEEKESRKQLSESIAQYIHSLPNDENEIDPDPFNPLPDDLSHFISYMTTERTILDSDEFDSDDKKMIWQVVEAAIADVVTDSVDSIIKGKDEKIDSYKKNLEQNCKIWLLIYSSRCPTVGIPDVGRVSTYGRITNELRARYFKTSFDRVYYFDKAESKVIQLKIER